MRFFLPTSSKLPALKLSDLSSGVEKWPGEGEWADFDSIEVSKCSDPVLQLIDLNGRFTDELVSYIDKCNLRQRGTRYNVCSILGGKSSGKSTLLNAIFDTSFEATKPGEIPNPGTRGILLSTSRELHCFVLDLEGADSIERDGNLFFERSAALFALLVSDVLLFNVCYYDIGRRNASLYSLMKVVFSVQLKIFSEKATQWRKTRLIICLRDWCGQQDGLGDFDDHGSPSDLFSLDACTSKLLDQFHQIWEQVPKPANTLEFSDLQDLLQIEVVPFHNLLYEKAKFQEDICAIWELLGDNWEYSRAIPVEALPLFAKKIWDHVRESKELPIVEESELIKALTCSEHARQALERAKEDIKWIQNECGLSQTDLRKKMSNVVDKALAFYSTSTESYRECEKADSRESLVQNVCGELEDIFKVYLSLIIKEEESSGRISAKFESADWTAEEVASLHSLHLKWMKSMEAKLCKCSQFHWNVPHPVAGEVVSTLEYTFDVARHSEDVERWLDQCWTKLRYPLSELIYREMTSAVEENMYCLWEATESALVPTSLDYNQLMERLYDVWHNCPLFVVKDLGSTREVTNLASGHEWPEEERAQILKRIIVCAFREVVSVRSYSLSDDLAAKFKMALNGLRTQQYTDNIVSQIDLITQDYLLALKDFLYFSNLCRPFCDTFDIAVLDAPLESERSIQKRIKKLTTTLLNLIQRSQLKRALTWSDPH